METPRQTFLFKLTRDATEEDTTSVQTRGAFPGRDAACAGPHGRGPDPPVPPAARGRKSAEGGAEAQAARPLAVETAGLAPDEAPPQGSMRAAAGTYGAGGGGIWGGGDVKAADMKAAAVMETQAAGPLAVEGPDRARDKATMRSPEEAPAEARAAAAAGAVRRTSYRLHLFSRQPD